MKGSNQRWIYDAKCKKYQPTNNYRLIRKVKQCWARLTFGGVATLHRSISLKINHEILDARPLGDVEIGKKSK
jgi:hypothetical protein